ncbi:hypothetical protein ACJJI4_10880 [Microbulbifer sp. TRSA002]|uniref:hypothetical protein n=1 Tax=Microbulbifer sp. TRSA002 TaxID=3243382 RepID=UPI00403A220A
MKEALDQTHNWLNLIRLELEVHFDNGAAIAPYEESGFQVEGTKRFGRFKAGRYIEVLLMARIRPEYQARALGAPCYRKMDLDIREAQNRNLDLPRAR